MLNGTVGKFEKKVPCGKSVSRQTTNNESEPFGIDIHGEPLIGGPPFLGKRNRELETWPATNDRRLRLAVGT